MKKFVFVILLFLIMLFPIFGMLGDSMIGIQVEKINVSGRSMELQSTEFVDLFQDTSEVVSNQAIIISESRVAIMTSYIGSSNSVPAVPIPGYTRSASVEVAGYVEKLRCDAGGDSYWALYINR